MIKNIITIFLLLFSCSAYAQRFVNPKVNYPYFYSFGNNCYVSDKMNKLCEHENFLKPKVISDTDFNSLNAFEHFIHSFYFPEWYNQSCSRYGYLQDILQHIPSLLKISGNGLEMSSRQKDAIKEHRDSTLILMRKCIVEQGVVDDNFKNYIVLLKAFELIPDLIQTIEQQKQIKDPYILTVLCLLMRYDYPVFMESEICKSLYPTDSNGRYITAQSYNRSIPFTQSNYKAIISFASAYYTYQSNRINEFVKIPAGDYLIGEKEHGINPQRTVKIKRFEISRFEITNFQFKQFIDASGYVTTAEKYQDAFVFQLGLDEFEWVQDSTANWRYPNGVTQGGIENKMNHPVTCISFMDAQAYCRWAHVRLPTIEEWEVASRAGNTQSRHYFGDSITHIYKYGNVWHGKNHLMKDELEDDITTSKVGLYEPNAFGIFDMYGNVFEFCSNIPEAFIAYENVVSTRGGSWWCSIYACGFFNSVDIGRVQKAASFSNNGFRVVR